jgi:hypothetical protein
MVLRSIVSALLLLLPLAASAQDAPSVLEMRRGREPAARRPIVYPRPPIDEAVHDAERATAEYDRAQRAEELARQVTRPAPRPDLGYDVTSGIQQRNIQGAPRP